VPRGAARDDVLDALVLAVRAAQWHTGRPPAAVVLGDATTDARGRPMQVRG
jgi:predicted RNase H-like nuclease